MTVVKADVVIQMDTMKEEDAMHNIFMIEADGVPYAEWEFAGITALIETFYNSAGDLPSQQQGACWAGYLSGGADVNRVDFTDYTGHLDGSAAGPASHSEGWTLAGPGAGAVADLPSDVAVVLSLRGVGWAGAPVEQGGIRPKARRSGRLYIGGLSSNLIQTGVPGARVWSEYRAQLAGAAFDLKQSLITDLDASYHWGIWSRAAGQLYHVEHVAVDDVFDRRKSRKLERSALTVV